jgi:methionyl-tRNA synthetase
MITIEDLSKIELVIAQVVEAEEVEESRKLIKLTLNNGSEHTKTVFAGIKNFYSSNDLIGKFVVMVNNLQPREMHFGTSEAMLLAASGSNEGVFLLSADPGVKAGMKIS